MKGFIDTFMGKVFLDFHRRLAGSRTFCALKRANFIMGNIPDYTSILIQQLYLLRYFPAYTVEYKHIYRKILEAGFTVGRPKVLSLGTGAGLDYNGLRFALQQCNGSGPGNPAYYTGVDRVDWLYRVRIPGGGGGFINCAADHWHQLDWSQYNVIIFPKVLSELGIGDFNQLLETLRATPFRGDRLWVVASIRQYRPALDVARFKAVVDRVSLQGYRVMDSPGEVHTLPGDRGLSNVFPGFSYPPGIRNYIRNLSHHCPTCRDQGSPCQEDCSSTLDREGVKRIAGALENYTGRLVISLLDFYGKVEKRLKKVAEAHRTEFWDLASPGHREELQALAATLNQAARQHGMETFSCAEEIDLTGAGIQPGSCIDGDLINRLFGRGQDFPRDPNQRGACRCADSVDVGSYNTCRFQCAYCYANYSPKSIENNRKKHFPDSSSLLNRYQEPQEILSQKKRPGAKGRGKKGKDGQEKQAKAKDLGTRAPGKGETGQLSLEDMVGP